MVPFLNKLFLYGGITLAVLLVLALFRWFEDRKNKKLQRAAVQTAIKESAFDTILVVVADQPRQRIARFVADLYARAANPGRVFVGVCGSEALRQEMRELTSRGNIAQENTTVVTANAPGPLEIVRDSFRNERYLWITAPVVPKDGWDSILVKASGANAQLVYTATSVPGGKGTHFWTVSQDMHLVLKKCVAEPERPLPNAAALSIDLLGTAQPLLATLREMHARQGAAKKSLTGILIEMIGDGKVQPMSLSTPLAATIGRVRYRLPAGTTPANASGLTRSADQAERFCKVGRV